MNIGGGACAHGLQGGCYLCQQAWTGWAGNYWQCPKHGWVTGNGACGPCVNDAACEAARAKPHTADVLAIAKARLAELDGERKKLEAVIAACEKKP